MSAQKQVRSIADGIRYRFPTHTNELILDRKDAQRSEVFVVVMEPGESPPVHIHDDTEQIFYILEGSGILSLGQSGEDRTPVQPGDLAHVPSGTYHSVVNIGEQPLRYLAVGVFTQINPDEPTWDDHVRTVCANFGWDCNQIRQTEKA